MPKTWTKLTNVAETHDEPEMQESPGLTAFKFVIILEKDGTWNNEKYMRKCRDCINAQYALYPYNRTALEARVLRNSILTDRLDL